MLAQSMGEDVDRISFPYGLPGIAGAGRNHSTAVQVLALACDDFVLKTPGGKDEHARRVQASGRLR